MNGNLLPRVRVDICLLFFMSGNLVIPTWITWWVDDSGVVPTIRQHECNVGVRQHLYLINRTPWGDMIRYRANSEGRDVNIS
jgi:hypothetical protein